jgi:hypothetical protein
MKLAIGDDEIVIIVEGPAEKFWLERKFGLSGDGDPLMFYKMLGPNGEMVFKASTAPRPLKVVEKE